MRKLGFGILMALLSLFVFNMDLEARKTWATGKHGIRITSSNSHPLRIRI